MELNITTALDPLSCRVCLSPSNEFINIFSNFHDRSVKKMIEDLTQIKINKNPKIPNYLCMSCFESILNASSIVELMKKNDEFLNQLANAEDEIIEIEDFKDDLSLPDENPQEILEIEAIAWESFKKNPKKSFFCSFCAEEFNTRSKLNYHEKSRHSKLPPGQPIKPFTCDRCGASFKIKSTIINHLNIVHLKKKNFKCDICSFSMYSKSHYRNHLKTHSKIREFTCEKCKKSFARKETLTVHLKTHENLRDYACKFCQKSYSAHTDLKKHIFKHTKIHPYVCQICRAGFFLKRQLFEHVGKIHSGVDTTSWLNGKTSWINLMN